MKIRIIQIGKNKQNYIDDWINELLKRIGPYSDIEIVTLKDMTASKTFPVAKCIEQEGEQILKNLKPEEVLVALDERGRQFSSMEFSEKIKGFKDVGQTVCFVIGGPYGLSEMVKSTAKICLSLSKMTLTHQMVRTLLLEQIYRALCIISGKEYHIA